VQTVLVVLSMISLFMGGIMAYCTEKVSERIGYVNMGILGGLMAGVLMSGSTYAAVILAMAAHACMNIVLFYAAGLIPGWSDELTVIELGKAYGEIKRDRGMMLPVAVILTAAAAAAAFAAANPMLTAGLDTVMSVKIIYIIGMVLCAAAGVLICLFVVVKVITMKKEENGEGSVSLLQKLNGCPAVFKIPGAVFGMLGRPLIMEAVKKLHIESKWTQNRELKRQKEREAKAKEAAKKRMKDHNKYR